MRKYAQITPEQVGYGLGGAAGGAALGYLASHLLDRKASTKRRLLYALIGAAGGAGISEYALSRMRRAPAVAPEEIEEAAVVEEPVAPGSPWRSKAAIGGAITGSAAGSVIGLYRAGKKADQAGKAAYNAVPDPMSAKTQEEAARLADERYTKYNEAYDRAASLRPVITHGVGGALLGYGLGAGASYFGRKYGTPR